MGDIDDEYGCPSCGNCKHWSHVDKNDISEKVGVCKRYPPQYAGGEGYSTFNFLHPLTTENNECGEWRHKGAE